MVATGSHLCQLTTSTVPVLVIEDLDGNQLFFPYPNEPGLDPDGLVRT
jgi:hypothetical protein